MTRQQKSDESMEELKGLLTAMDSKFTMAFADINSKYNSFVEGIAKVEKSITDKLVNLEIKLTSEVEALKQSNSNLTMVVNQEQKDTTERFINFEERLSYLENDENQLSIEEKELIQEQSLKITRLEKDLYQSLQHNRKWNVEIDGIPSEIGDEVSDLEDAVVSICTAINVPIDKNCIEACHRLKSRNPGPKPTIVRFVSRKTVGAVLKNKTKLKSLAELGLHLEGLTPESKIFINPSYCPYFKTLAYNCRLLKTKKLITSVIYEDDATLKIKTLNDNYIKIRHESDLTERFPHFEFKFN